MEMVSSFACTCMKILFNEPSRLIASMEIVLDDSWPYHQSQIHYPEEFGLNLSLSCFVVVCIWIVDRITLVEFVAVGNCAFIK
jgi:hypothetical protein